MTGFSKVMTDRKKERIAKFTKEGLSTKVIADRLGLDSQQVYNYQIKSGVRKKGESNEANYNRQ